MCARVRDLCLIFYMSSAVWAQAPSSPEATLRHAIELHQGGDVEAFLDREHERYRAQLEKYAALLARTESRPIRLGLYFPLLNGWREWEAPVGSSRG